MQKSSAHPPSRRTYIQPMIAVSRGCLYLHATSPEHTCSMSDACEVLLYAVQIWCRLTNSPCILSTCVVPAIKTMCNVKRSGSAHSVNFNETDSRIANSWSGNRSITTSDRAICIAVCDCVVGGIGNSFSRTMLTDTRCDYGPESS